METHQNAPPPFEEGVTQILVLSEELKRSLESTSIVEWHAELEILVERLDYLYRLTQDNPGDTIKQDLYLHVRTKTMDTFLQVLQHVSNIDVKEQAAVARIVELALIIDKRMLMESDTANSKTQQEEDDDYSKQVVNLYTSYQRFVLRNRSKPAIAYLATWRQYDDETRAKMSTQEDDDEEESTHIARPHSHALTTILGQASALIHPLLLWKNGLPSPDVLELGTMCSSTIQVLDEQAQALTKSVSDWFWNDYKIDEWLSQVAAMDEHSDKNSLKQQTVDLVELDALVEEMAFFLQLLARYQTLLQGTTTSTSEVQDELLPEWTWKYASLERFLARQQLKSALAMASPVSIILDKDVQVPSIVEDAQYLSTRALERASSTLSQQAMGTVAHSISHDVWSTDAAASSGGVHQALVEQRGCWSSNNEGSGDTNKQETTAPPPSGGKSSFASALLGALDEDLGSSSGALVSPPASKRAAPTSGSLFGSLVGDGLQQQQQVKVDMQLCQLNGIHSASAACFSLSKSIDDDDSNQSSSMIQLAREELLRYSQAYQSLVENLVAETIHEWCGSLSDVDFEDDKCIHHLRHFFLSENYELNETTFLAAEADERLEAKLLDPLRKSNLIENLQKCDAEVVFLLCKELSTLVATLLLDYLWRDKRFTDWGSLLLSKQVRMLQTYLSSLGQEENTAHAAQLLQVWQRTTQAVTLLQLEKPSDWAAYRDDNEVLKKEEVRKTLSLRIDFSSDAIAAVCGVACNNKEKEATATNDKQ